VFSQTVTQETKMGLAEEGGLPDGKREHLHEKGWPSQVENKNVPFL